MKKRILTLAIALLMVPTLSTAFAPIPVTAAASSLAASPTASTVYVNGAATAFEAYNIGGNNYFKLRDLAYALSGTAKQFEVGYDNATRAITLTSGQPYTPAGGEMARGDGTAKTASPTASRIYFDGRELNLTVYIIGGNNFFKLRDLMEVLDVFVGYDNATRAITLDTSKGYVQEGAATPTSSGGTDERLIGTWSMGSGTTRQVRMILSGKYDIRMISFNSSGQCYTFNGDGTYMSITVAGSGETGHGVNTGTLVLVEGRYSVSNSTITLTNRIAKTTTKNDVPIIWESTSNLADETHRFEIGIGESFFGEDMLYLDGVRDPGYSRSEDV